MTSLTMSVPEEFKKELKEFLWVNWSELARVEALKKVVFDNYMKTKEITEEEWAFCEKIDWHPVDELPLKKEFVEKMNKAKSEKGIRFKDISELREVIEREDA